MVPRPPGGRETYSLRSVQAGGWLVPLLLAVFLLVRYSTSFLVPFLADDLMFLQKTATLPFLSVWNTRSLDFFYYRPWSREWHFWVLQHLFGPTEWPFHAVSLALWITSLTLYFLLVRRLAGAQAAAVASAAVASLASWEVLLSWISGSQDLWMLCFALACLYAFVLGRSRWAAVLFLGALLSKETAVTLPAILVVYAVLVERADWRSAIRRTSAMWLAIAAWAVIHPQLGGRIGYGAPPAPPATWGVRPNLLEVLLRTPLSAINLDEWPKPVAGWLGSAGGVPVETFILVAIVLLATRAQPGRDETRPGANPPANRVVTFGAVWMCAAWVPLFMPTVWWHAYYGLLGVFGAWLALGVLLGTRRYSAAACVALLAVTGAARIATPSGDMGTAWYIGRAANFMRGTREFFQRSHPAFPENARIFVQSVPGSVGLVPGGRESPALRCWYGDTTLRMYYTSQYAPRDIRGPAGQDFFFVYDSTAGWTEETVPRLADAPTNADREAFARAMWNKQDYAMAAAQYAALADSFPDDIGYTFNAGSCYLRAGDSVSTARWYIRAARLPGAPAPMLALARKYKRFLAGR